MPRIRNEGGLWDESSRIYRRLGGVPREQTTQWNFPSGAVIKFSHLLLEEDKRAWHGAQLDFIFFDELTEFSASQFWYLTSRLRSRCGVRPYLRATCNPDADSWVKDLVDWWIDGDGFPIVERCGQLRWFLREEDKTVWVDGPEERGRHGARPKSFTFVAAKVQDNKALLRLNPEYLATLSALDEVEQQRYLHGNWLARYEAGRMFRKHWFGVVEAVPAGMHLVRYWDRAATEPTPEARDPAWTCGVLMGRHQGVTYVCDVKRTRQEPAGNERYIRNTSDADQPLLRTLGAAGYDIVMEQEPGSSGKDVIDHYRRDILAKYAFFGDRVTGSKVVRAKPLAAQALAGNVNLLAAGWNQEYLEEMERFPAGKKDQADASSGAYNHLVSKPGIFIGRA